MKFYKLQPLLLNSPILLHAICTFLHSSTILPDITHIHSVQESFLQHPNRLRFFCCLRKCHLTCLMWRIIGLHCLSPFSHCYGRFLKRLPSNKFQNNLLDPVLVILQKLLFCLVSVSWTPPVFFIKWDHSLPWGFLPLLWDWHSAVLDLPLRWCHKFCLNLSLPQWLDEVPSPSAQSFEDWAPGIPRQSGYPT